MAQVTVKINGYAYTVGCENGQEGHLQEMAREIETRIDRIKALGGNPSGEGRLLVLAALLMADELHDTAIELANLRTASRVPGSPPVPPPPAPAAADARSAARISMLARKAEDIAAGLDQA